MKHRIVLAVIVRDDRVLLGHRAPTRAWYANCWDVIGGHIELGESSERALVRECHEELGITVQRYQPVPVTLSDAEIEPSAFLVTQWEGEIRNMAPEEHDALRWFGDRKSVVEGKRAGSGCRGTGTNIDGREDGIGSSMNVA